MLTGKLIFEIMQLSSTFRRQALAKPNVSFKGLRDFINNKLTPAHVQDTHKRGFYQLSAVWQNRRLPRQSDFLRPQKQESLYLGSTPHRQIQVKVLSPFATFEHEILHQPDYNSLYREIV